MQGIWWKKKRERRINKNKRSIKKKRKLKMRNERRQPHKHQVLTSEKMHTIHIHK